MVIWIRYLLVKRSEALAELKTQADKRKLEAEQAEVAAKVEADVNKRKVAEFAAAASLSKAKKDLEDLQVLEAEHLKHVAQLQAVADKDWDTLNKLAGVK